MSAEPFYEHVYAPEGGGWKSDSVHVEADRDGYFVTIETDPYEGSAMMTLPAAKLLRAALDRAIAFAEERVREKGWPEL